MNKGTHMQQDLDNHEAESVLERAGQTPLRPRVCLAENLEMLRVGRKSTATNGDTMLSADSS